MYVFHYIESKKPDIWSYSSKEAYTNGQIDQLSALHVYSAGGKNYIALMM